MGVPEKAERGVLISEAGRRIEFVKDVAPLSRGIEGGVDNGEVVHLSGEAEIGQPRFVVSGKMIAGPADRFLRQFVEALGGSDNRGLLVVVSLHHRAFEILDDLDAFARVGVVTDDVAETDELRAGLGLRVREHGLERFEVRVDVAENGNTHG